MAKLYNLAVMTVSGTPGTGTITLGSAATVNGVTYLSFAAAGVANGDVVDYSINDTGASEIGTGTYTSAGTTLTRTVTKSTNSNTAISASASAIVRISERAETLNDASLITTGTMATARLGSGTANSGTALFGDQTYKAITVNGTVSVVAYITTQTITIPAGATRALVRLWGGTGGGGSSNTSGAGAGAGAGYLEKYLTGLTAANTLALTLGAAGTVTANANGGAGGNSTLASGTQTISTLTANGGGAGVGGAAAGNAGGAGGTATGGDFNITGQKGGFGANNTTDAWMIQAVGGVTGGGRSAGGNGGAAGNGTVGIIGGCLIEWYS